MECITDPTNKLLFNLNKTLKKTFDRVPNYLETWKTLNIKNKSLENLKF